MIAAVLTIVLFAAPADTASRTHFMRAQKAFAQHDWRRALDEFTATSEATTTELPDLWFDIGQCHRNLGHARQAVAAFERYLVLKPDAADREKVRTLIVALGGRVADDPPAPIAAAAADEPATAPSLAAPASAPVAAAVTAPAALPLIPTGRCAAAEPPSSLEGVDRRRRRRGGDRRRRRRARRRPQLLERQLAVGPAHAGQRRHLRHEKPLMRALALGVVVALGGCAGAGGGSSATADPTGLVLTLHFDHTNVMTVELSGATYATARRFGPFVVAEDALPRDSTVGLVFDPGDAGTAMVCAESHDVTGKVLGAGCDTFDVVGDEVTHGSLTLVDQNTH